MATPSKRTRITNQTKEDIKKDSKKPGFKIEDAMKKHGLGMSTLYRILKEEPKTQSSRDDAKCVKGVTAPHAELEKRPRKRPAEDNYLGNSRNCRPRFK